MGGLIRTAVIAGALLAMSCGVACAFEGIYADPEKNKDMATIDKAAWRARTARESAAHAERAPSVNPATRVASLMGQNVGALIARLGEPELNGADDGVKPFDFGLRRVHDLWIVDGCILWIDVDPFTHVMESFEWSEIGLGCQRLAAQLDGKASFLTPR
jgi:hypothetical protein